jgi:hypothetical protein
MKPFRFLNSPTISDQDRHNVIWRTHTGRCTPIFFMTNSHIKNCLNCLKGQGSIEIPEIYEGLTRNEWINLFEGELSIRELEINH